MALEPMQNKQFLITTDFTLLKKYWNIKSLSKWTLFCECKRFSPFSSCIFISIIKLLPSVDMKN